jgi:transmembrane sensor
MAQNRFWNLLSKKLSGEASQGEIKELEILVKENPDLVYSAEQVENLWNLEPLDAHAYDAELAFHQHLNLLNKQGIYLPDLEQPLDINSFFEKKPIRKRKSLRLGVLSFAIIITVAIFWMLIPASQPRVLVQQKSFSGEVSTKMGNRTQMVLPDSTVVWLNAGSRLNYGEGFGITNRNTSLTGEAFFEVKKSDIPFIIHANSVHIKVLGTAFNVKSYPDDKNTETSLVRGKVEITIDKRPGEKIILKPNEKLIVANDISDEEMVRTTKPEPMVVLGSITHSNDNTIIETSWIDNKLIFQDESFAELAVKMERWYGVEIEFSGEKIAKERLSGTFTKETIQEALEILQMTTAFHFNMKSDKIIITE